MQNTLDLNLEKMKRAKTKHLRMISILLVLSLLVSLDVFWVLRRTGITMAGDAACGIEEHTHTDECVKLEFLCGYTDEVHVHGEDCYMVSLKETEGETVLTCDLTEVPHVHTEVCYELLTTEGYDETVQVCENAEPDHMHDDSCFTVIHVEGSAEEVLVCTLTSEPHEHTEDCYTVEAAEPQEELVLICELSEEAHEHTEDCVEELYLCGKEEHTHQIDCYSDPDADVETQLDWQWMFAGYDTDDLPHDLVLLAKSQVGYTESRLNFRVDHEGERHGYTRYGAWYGVPYSNWSALFVSFCLHYAGAEDMEDLYNTGANSMAKAFAFEDRFVPAGEFVPQPGDLVFFRNNTVGIVADIYGYMCLPPTYSFKSGISSGLPPSTTMQLFCSVTMTKDII